MACCAALAFVLAAVRTSWSRLLGRPPMEDLFPPAATWQSGRDLARPLRATPVTTVGTPLGRPLAATVFAYAVLIHLLVATGLARVEPAELAGWAVRDGVLAAAAIGLLELGRRRTATAPALVGVGVVWFLLGILDMHVFAGFEFRPVPLVLDLAFHLSGWWLAIAAAGIALVQRRQNVIPIGAAA
jgi:hypothetical protein